MATSSGWRYSTNTFEVNTRNSNVKMLSLATDTHAKLTNEQATPIIANILLTFEPVFFAYRDICEQYGLKSGDYEGSTLGFEQYIDQMPQKLREWESLIRAVYIEDSPEERAIFPNKRTPFLSDTYEKRLEALGSLKLKVADDTALATASTAITSFYNTVVGARLVQQQTEGALGELSDLREDQRILMSQELMGALGQVINLHKNALHHVERYFDLSLLRSANGGAETVTLLGTLTPGQIFTVDGEGIDLNLTGESTAVLRNTSTNPVTIVFYVAANPGDPPGAGAQYSLQPGESQNRSLSELGFGTNTYLNIINQGSMDGSWEMEITE